MISYEDWNTGHYKKQNYYAKKPPPKLLPKDSLKAHMPYKLTGFKKKVLADGLFGSAEANMSGVRNQLQTDTYLQPKYCFNFSLPYDLYFYLLNCKPSV